MKKLVFCALLTVSMHSMAKAPQSYDLFTLTDDLEIDRGRVFHFQVITGADFKIKGFLLPRTDTKDCDHYFPLSDFRNEAVTVKHQTAKLQANNTCSYSGKTVINVGVVDREILNRSKLDGVDVVAIWMDYLVNGIWGSRSERIALDLSFNYSTEKWEVRDPQNLNQVVNKMHFVSNLLVGKVIGVSTHQFFYR